MWGETGDSDGWLHDKHYEWIIGEDSLADVADSCYEDKMYFEIIGNIYENPELLKDYIEPEIQLYKITKRHNIALSPSAYSGGSLGEDHSRHSAKISILSNRDSITRSPQNGTKFIQSIKQPRKPISIFDFEKQPVRTVIIEDDIWFVASDVTKILGYLDGRKAIITHTKGEFQK